MALTNKLTAIANSIRLKTGKTDGLTLDEMPAEIESISGGGGDQPQLNAPTINIGGNNLIISNPSTNGNFVSAFAGYVGGQYSGMDIPASVPIIDLSVLGLPAGAYNIQATCKGTNFAESEKSNEVIYRTPCVVHFYDGDAEMTGSPVSIGYGLTLADAITAGGISIEKTGYDFGGWYSDDGYTAQINTSYIITDDINIYAKFTERVLPVKGDIVKMSLGNATPPAGEQDSYRIISTSGNIALVVSMYTPNISIKQDAKSTYVYANNTIDTYLNTTFYNSLSTEAKDAIQSSDINVYGYTRTSSTTATHYTYDDYSTKTLKESLTRNVFALDVEDIEKYFGGSDVTPGTIRNTDLFKLFWNTTTQPTTAKYIWLRSRDNTYKAQTWAVFGNNGVLYSTNETTEYAARAAFYIDLTKIAWEKV